MAEQAYITPKYLHDHLSLSEGGEVRLPAGYLLTPAARQLLSDKAITIKWIDSDGKVYVDSVESPEQRDRVHPLNTVDAGQQTVCSYCGSGVHDKSGLMTHLDGSQLVLKTHRQIVLRGQIDSLIAQVVVAQCDFSQHPDLLVVEGYLKDIRSYLGHMLKSEVTGEMLNSLTMGGLDENLIHQVSHNPMKHLGHDHIVPDTAQGMSIAKLNVLRCLSRETELLAIQTYIDTSNRLEREDIPNGLNRLSSAFYIIMIMLLVFYNGNRQIFQQVTAR
ncbi:hypothetical protein SIN8267_00535 [Sinobacterium norvegicum]|uniref:Cobalamin adenosyltransferase-like domain-containing protein n=1 Tax=Sinobacterium norvegicum TaxID=1641715 RepID=A0ABN8EFM2_9GAMM|nr:ethanolamine utilization cob(I)yrinic acid a,c-diamide adenosyltransferase EutT [Sinobacterium norvegicum]CAH0990443.1 hypothetical protein SIN8267_00535 [Sinobacterium norvegicum]